jgi:hypothetical protein
MAASLHELFFPPRFCGPPGTVNGGFACGALAARCGGTAEVTLRRPIPPGRPLPVRREGDGALVVLDGGTPVAEGRPVVDAPAMTAPPVPPEVAAAVAGRAAYYGDPVFPGCFVCGPAREPGDGLRILPGPVADRTVWAAPWTPGASVAEPDGRVRPEVVWAALDCPAGIAAAEAAALPDDTAALLGRMTAHISARPRTGQACRVVAWPLDRAGRKLTAGSALVDPDGAVLAAAQTLWLTVPRPARRQTAAATR